MKIQNPAHLATVTDLHDVPTANTTDNAHLRDVVGNKGDLLDTSKTGSTKSLLAKAKGILSWLEVSAANTGNFGQARDTVGNKQDNEQDTIGVTYSIMAYVKALVREMMHRGVPHMASAYTAAVAFTDLVNITDDGVLTGVYAACNAAGQCHIMIIIDGTTIFNSVVLKAGLNQAVGIPFNHKFSTSLYVGFHASVVAQEVECGATWTTD